MTFREQLILQIANGVANKNGANHNAMMAEQAAKAIVTLTDAVIKEMDKDKD